MKISGRNQLKGKIKALDTDAMMAKAVIDIGSNQNIVSIITRDAVEDLGLSIGDDVVAIIKSTSVMVAKSKDSF